MPDFFNALSDRFCELHTEIVKILDGLPPEALEWVPGPEMNSLVVLIIHLTAAERYWIGVASNEPISRDREAEFRTKGLSADELKATLVFADNYARETLAGFALADLEALRLSPLHEKIHTTGWCLVHALEHTAIHTGHIELMRQLWGYRTI